MRLTSGRGLSMLGIVMALAAGAAGPIRAHHTPPPSRFNDTYTDVQGVVKEVRMSAPHAWIMLEVRGPKGEVQPWPLEAASPAVLEKMGVTPAYVKAGDTIKARCRLARVVRIDYDCILGFVKASDGTVKDWSGNNAPAPADF